MERKNAWEKYPIGEKRDAVMDFAEGYRKFISECKTERECATYVGFYFGFPYRAGVELQRNFRVFRELEAVADLVHRAQNELGGNIRGSATAKIDGVKFVIFELLATHFQFLVKACHIRLGILDFVGKRSEIAIGAFMPTKGNVNINSCHNIFPFGVIRRAVICLEKDTCLNRRYNFRPPPRPLCGAVPLAPLHRRTRTQAQADQSG